MEPSFSSKAWHCVIVRNVSLSGHAQAKHLAAEAPTAAEASLPGLGTAYGHCGGARCSPLRSVHAPKGEPAWTGCWPCCSGYQRPTGV